MPIPGRIGMPIGGVAGDAIPGRGGGRGSIACVIGFGIPGTARREHVMMGAGKRGKRELGKGNKEEKQR